MADTIAALATPPGRGGVGIIRVSGPQSGAIAEQVLGFTPQPRKAHYCPFRRGNEVLDQGIALFFPGPNSFTGEDVLELQGHGGPILLDMILELVLSQGARTARPGEFSERAFLNDKIDLIQAEAIADLINADSRQAAKSAMASMNGLFSTEVDALVTQLIQLRMYVEAAIDFPEEEIDFLSDGHVLTELDGLLTQLNRVFTSASQGVILREGMTVVLAGRPNAGKSSLLNALCGTDRAIVTEIEGTTRDVLQEVFNLDGIPLHIVDTAGLRVSEDPVEQIGIARAREAIGKADQVLILMDSRDPEPESLENYWGSLAADMPLPSGVTVVHNKIDLSGQNAQLKEKQGVCNCWVSAKTGAGLDLLRQHLKQVVGFENRSEGVYMARRRHLAAIEEARSLLASAKEQLLENQAGELLAEDLSRAQLALEVITGRYTSDDLLGEIFSSFCIGK